MPIALVFILSAALFCYMAWLVNNGKTPDWDKRILLAFRLPADPSTLRGPEWLEQFMKDFTALGGTAVQCLIGAGLTIYLILMRKYRSALLLCGILVSGLVVSSFLKYGFSRARPDIVSHYSYVFTQSFPSGHSMMSSVTFLTCAVMFARSQHLKRIRFFMISCAILLTFLVGISRIYLGVHWPSDVLAGWGAGIAWVSFWLGFVFPASGRNQG